MCFVQAIFLGTTKGSSLENHCEHKKLVKAFKQCSTLSKYQKVNTEEKFWKCDSVEKILLTYFFNIKYFIIQNGETRVICCYVDISCAVKHSFLKGSLLRREINQSKASRNSWIWQGSLCLTPKTPMMFLR